MGSGVVQLPATDHSAEVIQPEAVFVPCLATEGAEPQR